MVSSVASTVNLAAIKPQHTLLNSPLTHSLGSNQQVSSDFFLFFYSPRKKSGLSQSRGS